MYLMNTRPNICFSMNTVSQYLVKPMQAHLIAANHVMRYLKGTIYFGLHYVRDHDYGFRLGRKFHRQKEHLRWMLLSRTRHDLMV